MLILLLQTDSTKKLYALPILGLFIPFIKNLIQIFLVVRQFYQIHGKSVFA